VTDSSHGKTLRHFRPAFLSDSDQTRAMVRATPTHNRNHPAPDYPASQPHPQDQTAPAGLKRPLTPHPAPMSASDHHPHRPGAAPKPRPTSHRAGQPLRDRPCRGWISHRAGSHCEAARVAGGSVIVRAAIARPPVSRVGQSSRRAGVGAHSRRGWISHHAGQLLRDRPCAGFRRCLPPLARDSRRVPASSALAIWWPGCGGPALVIWWPGSWWFRRRRRGSGRCAGSWPPRPSGPPRSGPPRPRR
jgi:hypothetical protein